MRGDNEDGGDTLRHNPIPTTTIDPRRQRPRRRWEDNLIQSV